MKPVKVGLLGLGTVGGGTATILKRNAEEITRRAGRSIEIDFIATLDLTAAADFGMQDVRLTTNATEVVTDPEVDIVVELIGGYSPAKELVLEALENGKHVVTANKALIAMHGDEIFAKAQEKGVVVAFEPAVAGGIPIIKSLREGMAANKVRSLAGIINGTGNFILSEMREKGRDFDDVLAEAQALGYAEADPTFDVEGIDAAHKLSILSSIAFGIPLQFDKTYTEGISKITREDVTYAEELGYRIKHLGIARQTSDGIEQRVHPTLIPDNRLIANVNGVMNAVLIEADAVGSTLYYGAGAGDEATGSAVVADIIDITRAFSSEPKNRVPHLGFQADSLKDIPVLPIEQASTAYYLRLNVTQQAGALTSITSILEDKSINVEVSLEKGAEAGGNGTDIILLTNVVKESDMNEALEKIETLEVMQGKATRIRVESLS